MGCAGSQAGHGHDLVVAQAIFTLGDCPRILLAQHRGHTNHKVGDQAGAEEEVEPHTKDVHVGAITVTHLGVGVNRGKGW